MRRPLSLVLAALSLVSLVVAAPACTQEGASEEEQAEGTALAATVAEPNTMERYDAQNDVAKSTFVGRRIAFRSDFRFNFTPAPPALSTGVVECSLDYTGTDGDHVRVQKAGSSLLVGKARVQLHEWRKGSGLVRLWLAEVEPAAPGECEAADSVTLPDGVRHCIADVMINCIVETLAPEAVPAAVGRALAASPDIALSPRQ